MKIQNKYVFRTLISEFLYFLKMTHGFGMVAKPKHLGHVRTRHKSSMAARPKALGSDMVWENHCRLRDILLWIVIVVSLSISHLFARSFFGFLFFPNEWVASAPLRRHLLRFLEAKSGLLLSHWMRNRALFYMGDACRQIMVELSLVIDCLCFFFLFSLLTTKVYNCPLYLLFVKLDMFVMLKYLRSSMVVRSKALGSCQAKVQVWHGCWLSGPSTWLKNKIKK